MLETILIGLDTPTMSRPWRSWAFAGAARWRDCWGWRRSTSRVFAPIEPLGPIVGRPGSTGLLHGLRESDG